MVRQSGGAEETKQTKQTSKYNRLEESGEDEYNSYVTSTLLDSESEIGKNSESDFDTTDTTINYTDTNFDFTKENDNNTNNITPNEEVLESHLGIEKRKQLSMEIKGERRKKSDSEWTCGMYVWLIGFTILLWGLTWLGTPRDRTINYGLLPGETILVDKMIRTFEKKGKVSSYTIDPEAPAMGVFHYKHCPKPNVIRKTSYSTLLDDNGHHTETFFLQEGTTFDLQWNASMPSSVTIKELGFYSSGSSFYSTTFKETNVTYEVIQAGKVIVKWVPSHRGSRFQGHANFDFNLNSFNQTKSHYVCPLDDQNCHFKITGGSACFVVDTINYTYVGTATPATPYSSRITLKFEGDVLGFFLVLPMPLLIMDFLLWGVMILIIETNKRSREEEDDFI